LCCQINFDTGADLLAYRVHQNFHAVIGGYGQRKVHRQFAAFASTT
jgi:hypothetical protein